MNYVFWIAAIGLSVWNIFSAVRFMKRAKHCGYNCDECANKDCQYKKCQDLKVNTAK